MWPSTVTGSNNCVLLLVQILVRLKIFIIIFEGAEKIGIIELETHAYGIVR